jgi:3-oxoacyl-[acyl-carrier protein] reductase
MPRLSVLSRSVADQVVLVTGAASGMGRAIARLFADEGARVAVTDVDAAGANRVGDEIRAAGGAANDWPLDVADPARIDAVVADVVARIGPIDVLVNNAGVSMAAPITADDYEAAWQTTLGVNLTAYVRMIRASLPHLTRNAAGRIVNIASTEAIGAQPYISPYVVSKHGVAGLTKALAVELGPQGVTVNAVCPGPIRTGMTEGIPEAAKQAFARRRTALRRYGDPEEVAHMVLNLALPSASYVTGAVIAVDGGLTIRHS